MEKIAQFHQLCDEIGKTSSLKQKEELLFKHQNDAAMMDFFYRAFDPNVQNIYLEKRIGIGPKTINKVWPNLIKEFQIMVPDEIKWSHDENWLSMVHHLQDHTQWSIAPDRPGIRCVVGVAKDVVFRTSGLFKVKNTELIEDDLHKLAYPPLSCPFVFDGRLCSDGKTNISDIYDDYILVSQKDKLYFYLFDWVCTTSAFSHRLKFLEGLGIAYHVTVARWEDANFKTTEQIDRFKSEGYKKILLKNKQSPYKFGKSYDFLSLSI